ncbi:hypothetical protein GCM10008941_06020 [Rhizomicrobium palustre]
MRRAKGGAFGAPKKYVELPALRQHRVFVGEFCAAEAAISAQGEAEVEHLNHPNAQALQT